MNEKNLKLIAEFDMLDSKQNVVKMLNKVALIAFAVFSASGAVANYCLRLLGEAGGMYAIWSLCVLGLCLLYIYLHELTHALAVIIIKRKKPTIRFDALAASCGSSTIMFGKASYFAVATAPLIVFSAILIPLCVILPPQFFPIPYFPLVYNVFCSMGDVYMARRSLKAPKGCLIIDSGTEVKMYLPVDDVNV